MLALFAVLSTMTYQGAVPVDGGDYLDVPFEVPAGTKEIKITHDDGSTYVILDWGVWSPSGFRGWGGGNSEDIVIGEMESSRSYLPGPIETGTWHLIIGKAQLGAMDNMYTATVTCTDTTTLLPRARAPYNPIASGGRRWYAGDFHVHSTESGDAHATFQQIHDLAKQQKLDFVNISDHNTNAHHALLAAYQQNVTDVLFMRGAEITTYAGHGNSVGVETYVDHRIGFGGRTIVNVIDDVRAHAGIFIVNHPALDLGDICIGCAWEHADTPWDKVAAIELITGNFEIGVNGFVPRVITLWETQLDAGNHIAVVAGSDDHTAGMSMGPTDSKIGSPTTLVLADELSEAAIIDGVAHGRTMVKLSGPMDPDLVVTMRRNDQTTADIGDTVRDISEVVVELTVKRGNTGFAALWRDGEKLESQPITTDDFSAVFRDTPGKGTHRYRVEITNDGNQRVVVTSHFYVEAIDAPPEGCGCRSTNPAGAIPIAIVAFALRRKRRLAA